MNVLTRAACSSDPDEIIVGQLYIQYIGLERGAGQPHGSELKGTASQRIEGGGYGRRTESCLCAGRRRGC